MMDMRLEDRPAIIWIRSRISWAFGRESCCMEESQCRRGASWIHEFRWMSVHFVASIERLHEKSNRRLRFAAISQFISSLRRSVIDRATDSSWMHVRNLRSFMNLGSVVNYFTNSQNDRRSLIRASSNRVEAILVKLSSLNIKELYRKFKFSFLSKKKKKSVISETLVANPLTLLIVPVRLFGSRV